jgi:hypothetical protein
MPQVVLNRASVVPFIGQVFFLGGAIFELVLCLLS